MARGYVFDTQAAADAAIDAFLAARPTETVTIIRGGAVVGTEERATLAPVVRRTAVGLYWIPAERRLAPLRATIGAPTAVDVDLNATTPVVRPRGAQ